MVIERKACAPNIKAVAPGSATVVIATLNVIDKDNDVILPGFFGEQVGSLKPAHDWENYDIGKAWVREESNEALAELKFNLATTDGKDWHAAIKFDYENPPAVQEYSFGFRPREGSVRIGEFAGRQVRFLGPLQDGTPGIDLVEVSPVTRGAGQRTRTMTIKEEGQDTEPRESSTNGTGERKHPSLDALIDELTDQVQHLTFIQEVRQRDGKSLCEETRAKVDVLSQRFYDLRAALSLGNQELPQVDVVLAETHRSLDAAIQAHLEAEAATERAANEAMIQRFRTLQQQHAAIRRR